MQEETDLEELPPAERRRDTEFTLGPMLLLTLFFGLALVCGLCFGLGYSMGSRGARAVAPVSQQPVAQVAPAVDDSCPKPLASEQNPPQPAQSAVVSPPSTPAPSAAPIAAPAPAVAAQAPAPSPAPSATPTRPVVKPALPIQSYQPQAATALMVQIAAVSQQEDADVLVAALRKRGYEVAVQRSPADNQLHVRIGPFSNREDANAMRQKLLNDGYNAVVQP